MRPVKMKSIILLVGMTAIFAGFSIYTRIQLRMKKDMFEQTGMNEDTLDNVKVRTLFGLCLL